MCTNIRGLCDKIFPEEMQHTCLLTSNRRPKTGQSTDTTKVQLTEPMCFIQVPYKNMSEQSTIRAKMAQKQLCHPNTSELIESRNRNTLHSLRHRSTRLESVISR